jgi:starch synthase
MKIAYVASEAVPFVKTGGLADVAGALPKALAELGNEVKLFIPKYYSIDESLYELSYCWDIGEMPIRVAGSVNIVHVLKGFLPNSNVAVYFIDCPKYYHRELLYTNDDDEDERFILFSKAVIETLQRLKWAPDVVSCNDWQTGLIPLYLKDNYSWDKLFDRTATTMTIHNVGYQGRFSSRTVDKAEIRRDLFYPNSPIETWGDISFLKAGLSYAEVINTVSETYAREILGSQYGAGMEGILNYRKNDLYGIINGIDYTIWNPEVDKHIPFHYSFNGLSGKIKNKKYLLENLHLPFNEETPVIGMISRLVAQKGFDIFALAAPQLLTLDAQWVIVGGGEPEYENMFRELTRLYPHKIANYIGFNNVLPHLIEAGADMFLMPSHYEPCGLNQIYSLKYGTVPIVRNTGGLADTVQDWPAYKAKGEETGNGFSFNKPDPFELISTIQKAINAFHNKKIWAKIQYNGMIKDFSWNSSAKKYMRLYELALMKRIRNN